MTGRNDIERLVRTFLAEGSDRVADRVIDAALDQVDHTQQRRAWRVPWRFPAMTDRMRLAATALVIVVAAAAAYVAFGPKTTDVGGPSPTPTPAVSPTAQPSPSAAPPSPIAIPALTKSFTSPQHGYTIRHPATWTVQPATAPWPADTVLYWGDQALDELRSSDIRIVAASQPLAPGETAEEWILTYSGSAASCVDGPSVLPDGVTVGSEVGTVTLNGCLVAGGGIAPGGVVYDVIVIVDGRAYDFTVDGIVDAAYVQALLATVAFEAASAIDSTPGPSPS